MAERSGKGLDGNTVGAGHAGEQHNELFPAGLFRLCPAAFALEFVVSVTIFSFLINCPVQGQILIRARRSRAKERIGGASLGTLPLCLTRESCR